MIDFNLCITHLKKIRSENISRSAQQRVVLIFFLSTMCRLRDLTYNWSWCASSRPTQTKHSTPNNEGRVHTNQESKDTHGGWRDGEFEHKHAHKGRDEREEEKTNHSHDDDDEHRTKNNISWSKNFLFRFLAILSHVILRLHTHIRSVPWHAQNGSLYNFFSRSPIYIMWHFVPII